LKLMTLRCLLHQWWTETNYKWSRKNWHDPERAMSHPQCIHLTLEVQIVCLCALNRTRKFAKDSNRNIFEAWKTTTINSMCSSCHFSLFWSTVFDLNGPKVKLLRSHEIQSFICSFAEVLAITGSRNHWPSTTSEQWFLLMKGLIT